jgi:hypothetical protein
VTRFDAAVRAALIQDLLAQVRGRPTDLLPFDVVRRRLPLRNLVDRGIQEVPVERIVGTVQREREFNRAFLPREESLRDRWQEIEDLAEGARGFPPVELYRVGDTYFVVDGHHRVSVARAMSAPTIEARVKEFTAPVAIPVDASIEDVVAQQGLADFLETTRLSPEKADEFRTTEANGYERLLDHINVHRHFRGINEQREIPWPEAVLSWRDAVYRPMIDRIDASGILEEFPGRTATDLYLFTMDHLHYLRQRYGDAAARPSRLLEHFRLSRRPKSSPVETLRRWWNRIRRRG